MRGVSGRQVISPQAHEGRGEETAGALYSGQGRRELVFFEGASLTPVPPSPLATKPQRALDVREAESSTKLNSPVG